MASPNKPQNPNNAQNQPDQIEPLKLKMVNGFRARIKRLGIRAGKVLAPAVLVAHLGGDYVQSKFRDSVDYNPNKSVATEVQSDDKTGESVQEPEPSQNPTAKKSLWERAKDKLKKAKEAVKNVTNRSKIVIKYRETRQDMKNVYYGLLRAVDKTAYFGPFLFLFLATALLANKLLKMKRDLTETVDPEVEKNMHDIEAKINELVEAVNSKKYPSIEEIKALVDQFNENSTGLDEGLDKELVDEEK